MSDDTTDEVLDAPLEEHADETPKDAPSDSETHANDIAGQPPKSTVDDMEKRFDRLAKKMSDLEKERNEYAVAAAQWSALNNEAVKDPKFALEANRKLLDAEVITQQQFDELEAKLSEKPVKPGTKEPAAPLPEIVDPAIEWARKKQQEEELSNRAFFAKFAEEHPDVDETTPEMATLNRQEIISSARRLMAVGKSKQDAFELAYNKWAGKTEQDAELQGIAKARAANPALGYAAGGTAVSSQSTSLTEEELDAAKRTGLTPEEYAAARDPDYGSDLKI